MPRSIWRVTALGLAVLAACGEPRSLTRHAQPFAVKAVTYPGFSEISGQPSDFKNAYDDMADPPSWLFRGDWRLLEAVPGFTGPVLHQAETGGYPHIMIQRYAGTLFGPDGQLPGHYKVKLAIQPFESPDRFPPVGENAVLVYYKNPTTYVEVTVSNASVSVWASDQATPLSAVGWQDYFYYPADTAPGEIRRISCEVNTDTRELTYWVEGQQAATVSIPLLTHDGYHGFALRSHGNQLNFGELEIEGDVAEFLPSLPPLPPVIEVPVSEQTVVVPIEDDRHYQKDAHHPKGQAWGYWKKQHDREEKRVRKAESKPDKKAKDH